MAASHAASRHRVTRRGVLYRLSPGDGTKEGSFMQAGFDIKNAVYLLDYVKPLSYEFRKYPSSESTNIFLE